MKAAGDSANGHWVVDLPSLGSPCDPMKLRLTLASYCEISYLQDMKNGSTRERGWRTAGGINMSCSKQLGLSYPPAVIMSAVNMTPTN